MSFWGYVWRFSKVKRKQTSSGNNSILVGSRGWRKSLEWTTSRIRDCVQELEGECSLIGSFSAGHDEGDCVHVNLVGESGVLVVEISLDAWDSRDARVGDSIRQEIDTSEGGSCAEGEIKTRRDVGSSISLEVVDVSDGSVDVVGGGIDVVRFPLGSWRGEGNDVEFLVGLELLSQSSSELSLDVSKSGDRCSVCHEGLIHWSRDVDDKGSNSLTDSAVDAITRGDGIEEGLSRGDVTGEGEYVGDSSLCGFGDFDECGGNVLECSHLRAREGEGIQDSYDVVSSEADNVRIQQGDGEALRAVEVDAREDLQDLIGWEHVRVSWDLSLEVVHHGIVERKGFQLSDKISHPSIWSVDWLRAIVSASSSSSERCSVTEVCGEGDSGDCQQAKSENCEKLFIHFFDLLVYSVLFIICYFNICRGKLLLLTLRGKERKHWER